MGFILGMGVMGMFAIVLLNGQPPELVEVPAPYPVIEYRTVSQTEYIDRWHEPQIVTVNQTTTKEIIVEKVRIVNNEWREFSSLAEFTAWVEPKLTYLFPIGGNPETADCDDYAERMQLLAYKDGYLLSAQLVDKDGKVFGTMVSNEGEHDLCRINIGNDIYIFEPQPDKLKIIKVGDRD